MLTAEARHVRQVLNVASTPTYWSEVFDHNPNLVRENGFPLSRNRIGHRPYILGTVRTQHGNKFIYNPSFKAVPGEMYGIEPRRSFEDVNILIEPHYKPDLFGSNKDWGWDKYQAVADHFRQRCLQVNPGDARILRGVPGHLTPTFREACEHLAGARLYIGPEGGLHHAAAALGIPAVVIFGGHISPSTTGYDTHINLAADDAGCGNMFPCDHCKRAMAGITVKQVIDAAETILGD